MQELVPDVKAEIFARIDALASKLGVASEQVWRILCQQGFVASLIWITASAVLLIGMAASWKFLHSTLLGFSKEENKHTQYGKMTLNESYIVRTVISAIVTLIITIGFSVTFFSNLETIYTGLFNPEYYAFLQIKDLLK